MSVIRVILASVALTGVAVGWHFDGVPGWIAIGSGGALVIWGFNLDWRRKKREADRATQTEDHTR